MRNRGKEQNDRKGGKGKGGSGRLWASDEEEDAARRGIRWRKVFVIAVFYFFPESRGGG